MTVAAHIVGGTGDTSHLTMQERLSFTPEQAAARQRGSQWFMTSGQCSMGEDVHRPHHGVRRRNRHLYLDFAWLSMSPFSQDMADSSGPRHYFSFSKAKQRPSGLVEKILSQSSSVKPPSFVLFLPAGSGVATTTAPTRTHRTSHHTAMSPTSYLAVEATDQRRRVWDSASQRTRITLACSIRRKEMRARRGSLEHSKTLVMQFGHQLKIVITAAVVWISQSRRKLTCQFRLQSKVYSHLGRQCDESRGDVLA
ncbi:hypothetical protein IG631_04523 [Alternaria alternata]|nr:hypothetical protein IG631_04523 [Alternaria alternata]